MTFIWPWMLLILLLVPLLVGFYVRLVRQRQTAVNALGPFGIVQNQTGRRAGWQRHIPFALFAAGLTILLFSLSRPELPIRLPRIEGTVILAFDVSNSMLADDLEPTRLDAAKAAARTFVENQPSTIQIGVVAFGNAGLVVQPPTDAQPDILAAIDRLSPQGGTSLGQGIFTSLTAIVGEPIVIDESALVEDVLPEDLPPLALGDHPSAVIVLLTDGENMSAPDPLAVAQLAANAGVRIYPVGIGSAEGAVLEIDGFYVVTRLDETGLEEIASLTNGRYYQAGDEEALQEIYRNIDLQLTIRGEKMEITSLLAGLGAFILLIGGVLSMAWFGRLP